MGGLLLRGNLQSGFYDMFEIMKHHFVYFSNLNTIFEIEIGNIFKITLTLNFQMVTLTFEFKSSKKKEKKKYNLYIFFKNLHGVRTGESLRMLMSNPHDKL